ncbi:hypothetical protein MMC10_000200 [Thelotrema lepadinum]|nr:hypothetical protein [Thelotrema lepadinum]
MGPNSISPPLAQIDTDMSLFYLLRTSYYSLHSRLKRLVSLKTIRSIKFVQLNLYTSSLTDIRQINSLPH